MSVPQNFWRELYDNLPGLILVFRIDEDEQARLIFVNEQIREYLDYTPEQFVLASESESGVQRELEALVDEVADLSRKKEKYSSRPFTLHDKLGNGHAFDYQYRLFKLKSNQSHFLVIRLENATDERGAAAPVTNNDDSQTIVAESDLAAAAFEQAYNLSATPGNILLRGEPGVGKLTLARKMAGWGGYDENYRIIDFSADNGKVFTGDMVPENGLLVIHHIASMPEDSQRVLEAELKQRNVRVIATSSVSLETVLEKGRFSHDLYYHLAFQTVLIPPLRKRPEDIRALITSWLVPAAVKLGLPAPRCSEDQIEMLLNHPWNDNFREFFEVMRSSLLQMGSYGEQFKIQLTPDTGKQSALFDNGWPDSLLSFDDMNRQYLQMVLNYTGGKVYGNDGAAAILGLKPTTLQSKLKKLNVR